MATPQTVSFTSPGFDYSADVAAIERQRRLAEALQAQSMQPLETQTAGGWVVPISPLQGAAKIVQGYGAQITQKRADEKSRELTEKAQRDLANVLSQASEAYTGTPAIPAPSEDLGGGPGRPAMPADAKKAASIYMTHPMTAGLGTQLLGQEVARDRLVNALRGGAGAPAGNTMASGGGSVMAAPGANGVPGAAVGGPAGGVPMEAWLASDPSGKSYMEQLAKDYAKAQEPVVNRGYGLGRMVNGQYVPDPASLQQIRDVEGVKQPYEAPVTVKTSSGQEVQLSRPEYAEFQKTGQLPARYGQSAPPAGGLPQPQVPQRPLPANVPESDRAAYEAVASGRVSSATTSAPAAPKLGTVGLSQSQEDQIRQQGQAAANTEAGKEFISEMRKNYGLLRDVPATLENMERSRQLAESSAAKFMGPFGQSKLEITKFMRANVPGMGNLNTEGVKNVEELRSSLFNQVMDNLKKMDASPSQYQQQVMQEAFGTLGTDPKAVGNILDVFGDILRNRVDIHNQTVESAEGRGTTFPYDVRIKLKAKPDPAGAGKVLDDLLKKYGNAR